MSKKDCFAIKTFFQFKDIIKYKKNKKKILIIFIKYYLIKGFGIDWLKTFINLINKNYSEYNIKFYVDAGSDHGLCVLITKEKIDYIKLKSNKVILNKIKDITKKNKVLLNPDFNIVDVSKLKNYYKLKL